MKEQTVIKEEMVYYGTDNLLLSELLSVALGIKNAELLEKLSNVGIRRLSQMTKDELKEIDGVGDAIAYKIKAIFGIAKKLHTSKKEEVEVIRSPRDAADILDYLKFENQEHFVCLYLNTKNEVISKRTIFIGSLNASIVHPREVFKEALQVSAASIICAHNHPSGHPESSLEDRQVNKRLVEVGKTIGIEVLDHIIIGDNQFVSLKEQGHM